MIEGELQNRRRVGAAAAIEADISRCVLNPMGQELTANGIGAPRDAMPRTACAIH
jgi:hypothetical protein